jgi:hypothetical protein
MDVRSETYHITYEPATAIVAFCGVMRLLGVKDYERVKQLMDSVVAAAPDSLTLDLRALRFVNSLGMYLLMGFILSMRDKTNSQVIVQGVEGNYWQARTFRDLKRLMPRLKLEWEATG